MENTIDPYSSDPQITPFKTGLKYGFYLGLGLALLTLISNFANLTDYENPYSMTNWLMTFLNWGIIFVAIFMGVKFFRGHNSGNLTLGEGMSTSLFIGVVSGVIVAIFSFIFFKYISPDLTEAIRSTVDYDEMSEEQAEITESMMSFMMSPAMMAFSGFIGQIISSVVFGLISSLILRKE